MNTFLTPARLLRARNPMIAAAVAFALIAGCSSAPRKNEGADNLRAKLTQLQSNPDLATRAPLAMKEADLSVTAAEKPQTDKALAAHLVFIADHKIDIARAQAENNLAVDQRKALGEQREAMRLQARTQEADSANLRAAAAVADANVQKRDASVARDQAQQARDATTDAQRQAGIARDATANAERDADAARDATETAQRDAGIARDATALAQRDADASREANATTQRNAREMQKQIDELQAKVTDRGLVLTLGDVLFTSGTANLNSGANSHLGKLAAFLNKYPDRKTVIEGYTDSVGSDDYNQGLSQRRADAVKTYLIGHGVASSRLTASGKGESSPIGDNGSATGRQQNRRVEVIVENNLVSSR